MQFGLYTLPMLVALAAVAGSSLPTIGEWIVGHNSRLASSALRLNPSTVELTVSNLGDRPGVADEVVFEMVRLDDPETETPLAKWVRPHTLRFISDDTPVVPSGEVRKFRFALASGQEETSDTDAVRLHYGPFLNEASCQLIFIGTEFEGQAVRSAREVDCYTSWTALFPGSIPLFSQDIYDSMRAWTREGTEEGAP